MKEDDQQAEPCAGDSGAVHGSGRIQKRRLSIVIRQTAVDAHGRSRTLSQTVPLLGKHAKHPASIASPYRSARSDPTAFVIARATDKDILPEEREGDAPVSASSRSSSRSSSCVSSPTDSEDSDDETPPVDDEFAAGLEAMKARYDREHGIDRSLQARPSAGALPLLFRAGRRAAVSIDTSEPIRDEARDKVRQAIVVSLGPENVIGKTMVDELDRVKTVQDLRDFTARNAHNLSELGQIQVEMQMSALGAWSRGFNALRGAMMFGRLEKGRQFDADGNEIQLTPEEIAIQKAEVAAREAAAAAERDRQERATLEAEERERREQQERAAREAAKIEADRREREAAEEKEAAKREAERLARETAEREAELVRNAAEAKQAEIARLEAQKAAVRRRAEEERHAAIEAARQARLQAMRKSRSLSGSRPICTPQNVREKHDTHDAWLKRDVELGQIFPGVGIGRQVARPVSSQSARTSSPGGATRWFCHARSPASLHANLAPGIACPPSTCTSPRTGVRGSLPSVSMQRLAASRHSIAKFNVSRPTTAPGLARIFAQCPSNVRRPLLQIVRIQVCLLFLTRWCLF